VHDGFEVDGFAAFFRRLKFPLRESLHRIGVEARVHAVHQLDAIHGAVLTDYGVQGQRASLRRDLLESLFPRLGKTCYGHDREADWAREQRVCSRQHFQRYFTYSVPPDDIDLDAAYAQALDSSENCSTQSEQNVHS